MQPGQQPEQQPVIIPMQGQQIVYGADNQQYVLVQQQNPPQNGLINASYICSGIGLLLFGIILGPIGFILGLVAKSNGDPRGNGAMVFGGWCLSKLFGDQYFIDSGCKSNKELPLTTIFPVQAGHLPDFVALITFLDHL